MSDSDDLKWLMAEKDDVEIYDRIADWSRDDILELIFEMREYVWMYKDLCK